MSPAPTSEIATDSSSNGVPARMRAVGHLRYGGTEVVELLDRPVLTPIADQVLVKVVAAAINPLDWHMMTGTPWIVRLQGGIRRPKKQVLAVDVAGMVVAVGPDVMELAVGDEVMGVASGAGAEYVIATPDRIVRKPAAVDFEEAAGMGVAAVTALQGLRDKASLKVGQRVLINGASGGVGLAAVQIAKHLGAEVTGVCSTRNIELVRSVGADHVVDYTNDDFTETGERYDVIFDNQGNRPLAACRKLLTSDGVYLLVGGPKSNRALGPIGRMIRALIYFKVTRRTAKVFVADERRDDLQYLSELMADGHLRTVIDKRYALEDAREAMDYLATGRARGKVLLVPGKAPAARIGSS